MCIQFVRFAVLSILLIHVGNLRAQQSAIREYRDVKPSIDMIDPVRVLSSDKAAELEEQIKSCYARLATSVVRIWTQLPPEAGTDENGKPLLGSASSGVIISQDG